MLNITIHNMSKFLFDIAGEDDDASLREILKETPMNGTMRVSLLRDPSIFHSIGVLGRFNQVIIAKEKERGSIAGFGIRTVREAFVNGEVQQIGYLSSLRIRQQFRGLSLLARGYNYLKKLHEDQKTDIYLTTIVDGNTLALRNLVGGRAGIPRYREIGKYLIFALDITKRFKGDQHKEMEINRGSRENIHEIIQFVNESNAARQFAPYYRSEEIILKSPLYRDLQVEDFYFVRSKGSIKGVLAKWDQSAFKQIVVSKYKRPVYLLRPIINTLSHLARYPSLPKEGQEIRSFYAGFIAVKDNSPAIFSALLRQMCKDNRGNGYTYVLVGLHSQDRLAEALKGCSCIRYDSRLYAVYWEDGKTFFDSLDDRPPYLELSTL